MKRNWIDQAADFMAGKGFYIVLLLCVAALGVSGYYLFDGISQKNQVVSGPAQITVTPTPAPVPSAEATLGAMPSPPVVASSRPRPTAPPATPTPAPAPTTVPTPAPLPSAPATATASVFTWPVNGELIREYAIETLAYDPTMGDWRSHDGIDIACSVGTQVKAPAGGTVIDLYTDDMMGMTVSILHADGVVSVCSNLAVVPTVEIGDTVRTGDIIGSVGESAIAESEQAPHLHLSMSKNGVSVDPLSYLPER